MRRFALVLSVLVLTGQGCLGFGGGQKPPDGGVFRSGDAGGNWVQTVAVPAAKGVGTIGNTNLITLSADPQDARVLYLGTRENGLLYSEDAGVSWRQFRDDALKTGRVDAVAVDPKDVCTVFVAHGQRLFKTTDCGRTFDGEAYVETRAGVSIRRVVIDWFNTQIVWIALSNGDVIRSTDGGRNWRTSLSAKDDIPAFLMSAVDSRVLLIGTATNGFYRSVDAGETWTPIKKELNDLRNASHVFALVQTADAGVVLAATKYGLIRSKDFGASWEPLTLLSAPGQLTIKALGVDPKNANHLYYAALSTFYSSEDGGTSWKTAKLPSTRIPEVMHVDPKDASVVYLGVAAPEKK